MSIFGRKIDTLNNAGGEAPSPVWLRVHDVLDYSISNIDRALLGAGMGDLIEEARQEDAAAERATIPGKQAVATAVGNSAEFVPVPADIASPTERPAVAAFVTEAGISPEVTAASTAVNDAYTTYGTNDIDQQLVAMGYGAQGEAN